METIFHSKKNLHLQNYTASYSKNQ